MRISDWSSDVCSSDLAEAHRLGDLQQLFLRHGADQAVGHVRVLPHEAGVRAVARQGEADLLSLAASAHRQRDVLSVVVSGVEIGGRPSSGAGRDVWADRMSVVLADRIDIWLYLIV